jgi:hypothetical protein
VVNYTPPHQKSIWSTTPRPLPPIQPSTTQMPIGTTAYRLTPFPNDFGYLPREEKKGWEKQRKEELKFLKALEKEQKAAIGAEGARKEREAKVLRKQQKDEIKYVFPLDSLAPFPYPLGSLFFHACSYICPFPVCS